MDEVIGRCRHGRAIGACVECKPKVMSEERDWRLHDMVRSLEATMDKVRAADIRSLLAENEALKNGLTLMTESRDRAEARVAELEAERDSAHNASRSLEATYVEMMRERDEARAERDEARRIATRHHLEACESCAVTESDLIAARAELEQARADVREEMQARNQLWRERDEARAERDRFREIVQAVSPVLDPSALAKSAELFGDAAWTLKRERDEAQADVAMLRSSMDRLHKAMQEVITVQDDPQIYPAFSGERTKRLDRAIGLLRAALASEEERR